MLELAFARRHTLGVRTAAAAVLCALAAVAAACADGGDRATPDPLTVRLAHDCHVAVGAVRYDSGGIEGFNGLAPYRLQTSDGRHHILLDRNDRIGGDGRWRVSCDGKPAQPVKIGNGEIDAAERYWALVAKTRRP